MVWKQVACLALLGVALLMSGCGGSKEVEFKSESDKMTPEHRALVEQMKQERENQNSLPQAAPQQNGGVVQPPSGS